MLEDTILKLYPNHKILGIDEVFYPSSGWKSVKTSSDKLFSWVKFYKEWGVTHVNFLLENVETRELVKPDFSVGELLQ